RRGLLRAAELLFWGYLLQVNAGRIPEYLRGEAESWVGAFHVLQCIAVGLLLMIAIHGLARGAGRRALAGIYLVSGFTLFGASILVANHTGYLPASAPAWLQNPLKGPRSSFPVAPWLGFTLYGAAIGVLLRKPPTAALAATSCVPFFAAGLLLKMFGWSFDEIFGRWLLDLAGHGGTGRVLPAAFHGRIGETLVVLGLLVWIENRFRPNLGWLQTIGRNTFPIYVGHVIVLYGGIFGIGLNDLLRRSLNPWQAAAGALLFCAAFGFAAQWTEALALRWQSWRGARRQRHLSHIQVEQERP
ncbi:MAG: heparan-alpha-glucosaminide N-acetyltransferase domain-containing protein, partial [Luteolibacter sp.]